VDNGSLRAIVCIWDLFHNDYESAAGKEPAMTYKGHVKNGVIVLEQPVQLPEGTVVHVEVLEGDNERTLADRLKDVIGIVKGMPSDMARNHDHYLHGRPRK
jgi:predicted DNA-binding antitoxin AbrB/MazE fold protein